MRKICPHPPDENRRRRAKGETLRRGMGVVFTYHRHPRAADDVFRQILAVAGTDNLIKFGQRHIL